MVGRPGNKASGQLPALTFLCLRVVVVEYRWLEAGALGSIPVLVGFLFLFNALMVYVGASCASHRGRGKLAIGRNGEAHSLACRLSIPCQL